MTYIPASGGSPSDSTFVTIPSVGGAVQMVASEPRIVLDPATYTVQLPSPSTLVDGQNLTIKGAASPAAMPTIESFPGAGSTIDGAATFVFTKGNECLTLAFQSASNNFIVC